MKALTQHSTSATTPLTTIHQFNKRISSLFKRKHTLMDQKRITVFNPLILDEIEHELLIIDTVIKYELTH